VLQINTFGPTGSLGQNGVVNVEAGATLLVTKAWAQFALGTISPVLNLNGGNLAGMTLTVVAPVGTQTQGSVRGFGTVSGAVELGSNAMTVTSSGVNFTNATLATTLGGGTITGTTVRNFGFISGTGVVEAAYQNRTGGLLLVEGGNMSLTSATAPTNTGTIVVKPHVLDVSVPVWTNQGYVHVQGGSVRTGGGAGLFVNAFYISTGSSIDSNFSNTGTFDLTNHTSITGNFTNAGWTNLGGFNLTVFGSQTANTGNGNTTGVFFGEGTFTFAPTSGEATFTNTITSAAGSGGNYDTSSMTFNMASGTLSFEVTSRDMGSGAFTQLYNGFAMGTLTLPNTLSLLALLDNSINQGGGTQEAIYVQNLHLGSALTASNFDFGMNSLKIYYNHIIGDGGVNFVGTYDGAERIIYFNNIIPMSAGGPPPMGVIPEPSTLALLLLGIPLLWFIWRKQKRLAVSN
jgi:hypothetical protein